jgi:hypothetical protein
MGNVISLGVSDKINKNWGQLECSYLGGPLQSLGLAPGDPKRTAQKCQNQQFGSMFGKSMGGTFNMMNIINDSMGMIKKDLYKFKDVINSIKKQVGKDVAAIVTKFFDLYKRIIKIVFVFVKHLNNIMRIFRDSFNVLFGFYWLFSSLINLLIAPINAIAALVELFSRKPSPFKQTADGVGSILGSGIGKLPDAILKMVKKKLIDPVKKPFDKAKKGLRKIGIKL